MPLKCHLLHKTLLVIKRVQMNDCWKCRVNNVAKNTQSVENLSTQLTALEASYENIAICVILKVMHYE